MVIDPQNDFLSPDGAGWPLFGQSVTENNVVANLARLFQAAESSDMTVAASPHYHYPTDGGWRFAGPAQQHLNVLHSFEVAVVRDATAAPRVAAGDAYLAALTNYSFLANAVWMTEEVVSHIRGGGLHSPTPVDEVVATV